MKNRRLECISLLNKIVDIISRELDTADVVTKEVPDTELRLSLAQLRNAIQHEPEYKAALEKGMALTVPLAIEIIHRLKQVEE